MLFEFTVWGGGGGDKKKILFDLLYLRNRAPLKLRTLYIDRRFRNDPEGSHPRGRSRTSPQDQHECKQQSRVLILFSAAGFHSVCTVFVSC